MARKKGFKRKAKEINPKLQVQERTANGPGSYGEPHTSSLREQSGNDCTACRQTKKHCRSTPSNVVSGGFFGGANGISINGGSFEDTHGQCSNLTINDDLPVSQEVAGQQHQLPHPSTLSYTSDNSNKIYERHLQSKQRGFPLWIPGPSRTLPMPYQRKGLDIGDVGIITPSGGFSFLFNICLPPDHPINPPTLPDGFTPIQPPIEFERMDIREEVAFKPGSHLASGIKAVYDPQTSGLSFVTEAAEGAVLTMPDGAVARDVENILQSRVYVAAHIESWYRYANVIRGRDVKNGDIRIVYGCDKATSWGMTTFANMTEHEVHHLKYRMIANGGGTSTQIPLYKWEKTGSTEAKVGPEPREIEDLKRDDNSDVAVDGKYGNQTLFIRTLNVRVKDDVFAEIEQEVEAARTQKSQQYRNRGSLGSSSSISPNTESQTNQRSGGNLVNQTLLPSAPLDSTAQNLATSNDARRAIISKSPIASTSHPADVLNKLLFEKVPNARVVITEDENWCSVIEEDDDIMPSPSEIAERVLAVHHIRNEHGVVTLEPKNARFLCTAPECDTMFTRESNLKDHLLSHDKYKCKGCRNQFASMDALNEHLRSRAGEECARAVESVPAAEFSERLVIPDGTGNAGGAEEVRVRPPQNPHRSPMPQPSTTRYPPDNSNKIYQRHLQSKQRGFPLWIPGPNTTLPMPYRRKGLDIGDVGVITPSGAFSFLFNICLPPDHPINPPTLPDGFTQIEPPIERTDIREYVAFKPGSHLASGIKEVHDPQILGPSFVTEAPEGAVLTMPDGAMARDLENILQFEAYVAAHSKSWYRYANVIHGREVKNGDILLVYGCDKATSWGIATFANTTEHDTNYLKYHSVANGGASPAQNPLYTWEKTGSTEARVGPEPREIDDLKRDDNSGVSVDGKYWNQTLFIRTLNSKVNDEVFAEIEQEMEAATTQQSQQYSKGRISGSSSSNSSSTITQAGQQSGGTLVNRTGFTAPLDPTGENLAINNDARERVIISECPSAPTSHSEDVLNKLLLRKMPPAARGHSCYPAAALRSLLFPSGMSLGASWMGHESILKLLLKNGCHNQFARMDAPNEHLKSRAGEECVTAVESAPAAEPPERPAMPDGMGDGGRVEAMRVRPPQNPHLDQPPLPQPSTTRYVHESTHQISERHLQSKQRDFPLWIPEPNMILPMPYPRKGTNIGHVGYVTPAGGFSFLFDICHPSDHPINPSTPPLGAFHDAAERGNTQTNAQNKGIEDIFNLYSQRTAFQRHVSSGELRFAAYEDHRQPILWLNGEVGNGTTHNFEGNMSDKGIEDMFNLYSQRTAFQRHVSSGELRFAAYEDHRQPILWLNGEVGNATMQFNFEGICDPSIVFIALIPG